MWGDPHQWTLDGLFITFNGYGEYIMTKTETYEFQARIAQYTDNSGRLYNASAYVAFAARENGSSTVQVSVNNARDGT